MYRDTPTFCIPVEDHFDLILVAEYSPVAAHHFLVLLNSAPVLLSLDGG